jgi:type VI secretion system protein ImpM
LPETVATPDASSTGFFGKLPSHGDFLTRRLSRGFTDPWDSWLQSVIASSREQLADNWLNIYLTSPLWRFALSPGLCGSQAWAGLLMPSVDRVGRYFPLTLAAPVMPDYALTSLVSQASEWYEACESLALSSLEDQFDLETFDRSLHNLPGPIGYEKPASSIPHQSYRPSWQIELPNQESFSPALTSLCQILLDRQFQSYSLWWTHGSEQVSPSLLIAEGLPPMAGFSALLDGNWETWGWGQYRIPLLPQQHARMA